METYLQAKAEKYETKTAQCEEWARQATEGPERALYEELAGYYSKLQWTSGGSLQSGTPP